MVTRRLTGAGTDDICETEQNKYNYSRWIDVRQRTSAVFSRVLINFSNISDVAKRRKAKRFSRSKYLPLSFHRACRVIRRSRRTDQRGQQGDLLAQARPGAWIVEPSALSHAFCLFQQMHGHRTVVPHCFRHPRLGSTRSGHLSYPISAFPVDDTG